tara:strand:+ start:26 stop:193 length:168 start_codon:yes stop_codon:yes gene_type:complete
MDIIPSGYTKVKQPDKPKFNRNEYYEEYITNIVPSNFIVKRVGNNIVIQINNEKS